MKNRKFKAKKGMTLIEVIISVTLLSILIVPISGFMISSLKNNIASEKKQEASYIGQKILEELKVYDSINLKKDNDGYYFELLDGDKVYKDDDSNKFEAEIERDIYGRPINKRNLTKYKVNLIIEEDNNFRYDDISDVEINNNTDYKINLINNNEIQINDYKITIDNNLITINNNAIKIENNEINIDDYVSIFINNNEIEDIKINKDINKLVIYISSQYNKRTNIKINNSNEKNILVYKIKQKEAKAKINIENIKGRLVLYEQEKNNNTIANMYTYSIKVRDEKENILFESKSSNNIKIK